MKLSRATVKLGVAVFAAITSSFAAAGDPGWYAGANIGQSRTTIDNGKITRGLLSDGITTTSIDSDDRDIGYKFFGGYRVNRHFALEGGYFDLGEFSFTAATVPAGPLSGAIKVEGVNLDLVGILPLTEKLSAFGRAGLNRAEAKVSFAAAGLVNVFEPNRSERTSNYKFGAGLQYDFSEAFGMRVEAERYRIDDAVGNKGDVDLLSAGLVFRFGGRTAPAMRAGTSPPAPGMEPVVIVVPAPAQIQQYCSILHFQFEVNQDDIQREEKEKLAVVGTFLEKYPDTTAVIEGHTDNVGTAEDNMKLSQRRAENVVTYLQDNFHITPARLTAVGYGDTRPLADNESDEGKRLNRRIGAVVACATDIEGLKVMPARITMAMLIEFDRNKANVGPEYHNELRKVANFLKMYPSVTATVEGHTGNLQATPELAMEISQRRAQNVVNYLVDNFQIARSRLTAEGFGQTRRFAYNTSLEGQQENRRVNIIINYAKP